MKTYEVCFAAVKKYGRVLYDVPELMKTHELCLKAVQYDGAILRYVPMKMRTREVCLAAIRQHSNAFQFVPEVQRTPELWLAVVQSNGRMIQYIPEDKITPELCLAAVQQCGWAITCMPEQFQTEEIINAAIANDPSIAQFIQIKIKNGDPRQMPEKAFDILEMGYDEDSAINDGEEMVDFHREFEFGRHYRLETFEKFVLPSKRNPLTGEFIQEYTIYKAVVPSRN
jgi:hypothetical protein